MSKPKRKTKAQREAEEKAALLQRIEDIMETAGCDIGRADDGTPGGVTTVMEYGSIVRAIKSRFLLDNDQEEMVGHHWNAGNFVNQDTLTAWLYERGVRA